MTIPKANLNDLAKREMYKLFAMRVRNEELARALESRPLKLRDVLAARRDVKKPTSARAS